MKVAIDHLPKMACLLAEVIGLPATLALTEHFGGQTIWPARGGAGYAAIAEVIGDEAAAKLVRHFREPIPVRKCDAAIRAVLHDRLRSDFDERTKSQGESARTAVAHLVRQYGYTDRHVWRLLGRADNGGEVVDASQAELF